MEKVVKMPFGKFKDKPLDSVPASYLMFLHNNQTSEKPLFGDLKSYIDDNLESIKEQAAKEDAEFQARKAQKFK